MVLEVVDEDMDLAMSCTDHPYKNHTPGGICAFCLQDKLGKLVSSSFPSAIFPASATSSIASPRAELVVPTGTIPVSKQPVRANAGGTNKHNHVNTKNIIFQRSKSTAVHRQKGRFWSFLSLNRVRALPSGGGGGVSSFRQRSLRERRGNECVGEEGDCFSGDDERKVSRSRSVGCGSRSFSGDFFERISTGFGDCTLRRVESQREKPKNTPVHGGKGSAAGDKVRCGGIFGGFSSSSSSSSSTNWTAPPVQAAHGRSRSWGWALASPMRAFSKTKRERGGSKRNANVTPNLNAIPSLLAVGG